VQDGLNHVASGAQDIFRMQNSQQDSIVWKNAPPDSFFHGKAAYTHYEHTLFSRNNAVFF